MIKCENCKISFKKDSFEQEFIEHYGECFRCHNGDDTDRELLRTIDPKLREIAEMCVDSRNKTGVKGVANRLR